MGPFQMETGKLEILIPQKNCRRKKNRPDEILPDGIRDSCMSIYTGISRSLQMMFMVSSSSRTGL